MASYLCVLDSASGVQLSVSANPESCSPGSFPVEQFQPFNLVNELAVVGVDGPTVLAVYAWGVASVLTWWFGAYCVRVALDMIRKV